MPYPVISYSTSLRSSSLSIAFLLLKTKPSHASTMVIGLAAIDSTLACVLLEASLPRKRTKWSCLTTSQSLLHVLPYSPKYCQFQVGTIQVSILQHNTVTICDSHHCIEKISIITSHRMLAKFFHNTCLASDVLLQGQSKYKDKRAEPEANVGG